jgi:hypothetical protein
MNSVGSHRNPSKQACGSQSRDLQKLHIFFLPEHKKPHQGSQGLSCCRRNVLSTPIFTRREGKASVWRMGIGEWRMEGGKS